MRKSALFKVLLLIGLLIIVSLPIIGQDPAISKPIPITPYGYVDEKMELLFKWKPSINNGGWEGSYTYIVYIVGENFNYSFTVTDQTSYTLPANTLKENKTYEYYIYASFSSWLNATSDAVSLYTNLYSVPSYSVSGTLQSIPSKTIPSEAKVTLKNIYTGEKFSQRTKDGIYSIIGVPYGPFEERVELQGHYIIIDTIAVTGNKVINEKLMKDTPLTSELYLGWNRSLLFLFKSLTNTQENNPVNQTLNRSRDSPLRIDARNYSPSDPLSMPQGIRPYLDTVLLDYSSKTDGLLVFTEENIGDVRVKFQYPPTAQMPEPAFGYTIFGYDLTNIWIDREYLIYYMNNLEHLQNNGVFARELYRATNMRTNSADPNMVSYYDGPTTGRLHPDEAEVIKRVFTLDNGTNMKKYRDVVVQSISNVLPQIIAFSAPVNNSTVTYDTNGNLIINYNSINPSDGDGEAQRVVIRLRGNGLDQYVTDANTDGIILVPNTTFQPLKQYTLEGMAISGFDTVSATNSITFDTPIETFTEKVFEQQITVYPNPVNDFLYLKNIPPAAGNYSYRIYSSDGSLLIRGSVESGQAEAAVNTSSLSPGLYLIEFRSGTCVSKMKFIRQ